MQAHDMTDLKKQQKKLLIFAHRGEAQVWFDQLKFKSEPFIDDGLWQSEDSFLLISDEGLQKTTEKLAILLARRGEEISEIINLGVVGKLNQKLEIGKVYPIRTCYYFLKDQAQYKSFHLNAEGVDCISSHQRLLNIKQYDELKNFADVVDRELWAICSVAAIFKIQVQAFKLISDDAGFSETIKCHTIQENAFDYSLTLFNFYKSIVQVHEHDSHIHLELKAIQNDQFYFTRSMQQQLQSLVVKLKQKDKLNDDLWNKIDFTNLIQMKMKPKDRSLEFIKRLNEQLNPLQTMLKKKLQILTEPYEQKKISFHFSQDFEDPSFQLQLQITANSNINELTDTLKQVPVQKIISVLNGEWDV